MVAATGVIVRVFARTDVGRTREHNEDAFLVADLRSAEPLAFDDRDAPAQPEEIRVGGSAALFMVADGLGGAAAGEVASHMAVHTVFDALRSRLPAATEEATSFAAALRDATLAANDAIHRHAQRHRELHGMGTTVTAAALLGDTLFVAQVGDSRAYLVRDGAAQQITKDQSLMQKLVEAGEITPEQAELSARRNIILQALGPEANVKIDLTHQQVRRGDLLVLCSDGLSGQVRGDEIGQLAATIPELDRLCRELVSLANERGGPDNITVVAARFDGDALPPPTMDDAVGHRTFPLGPPTEEVQLDQDTLRIRVPPPVEFPSPSVAGETGAIEAGAEAPVPEPPGADASIADHLATMLDARRERARLYSLVLLVAAVVVGAVFLWRVLKR
jgi:protein phosphatase